MIFELASELSDILCEKNVLNYLYTHEVPNDLRFIDLKRSAKLFMNIFQHSKSFADVIEKDYFLSILDFISTPKETEGLIELVTHLLTLYPQDITDMKEIIFMKLRENGNIDAINRFSKVLNI